MKMSKRMWALSWVLLTGGVAGLAGCSAVPDVAAAERASEAVGMPGAIAFRAEGRPVDRGDQEPGTLTMANAVRMALESDGRVQAALARVRVAESEAKQARLLPNPILSVVLRWPEAGGAPVVEAGLAAELLEVLRIPGRARAADHRLRGAAAAAVTVALDVVAEVQEAYVEARALGAVVGVLEDRRELVGRLSELAGARLRAGEGTRLDVTTVESQRVSIEVEAAERQLDLLEARLRLSRLIGRERAAAQWELEGDEPGARAALEAMLVSGDEAEWIGTALERRPEIQERLQELAALGVEAKLVRGWVLEGSTVGVDAEREGDWTVGPGLSAPLPIFDWGQARSAGAVARRVEAAHELSETRRRVVEEVRRAYAAARSRQATVARLRDELLPLLERRRDEAEAVYRAGESDVIPLLLSEQELAGARARWIESQADAARARIRLERAAGGPRALDNSAGKEATP